LDTGSAEYEDFIRRNYRWNFFANVADLAWVNLARSFIFSSTILTLYASYLTSSAVLIGLIPAVQQVGFLLPQLLTARYAETLSRKKPFVVKVSVWERLPYLFIALSVFLWPGAPRWFAYTVLALNIAVASGSGGIATPAWKTMLGKVIHPDRRARLFSTGYGLGSLMGVGGAALARFILDRYEYPRSFAICFLLSFLAQGLSWLFLTFNREPEGETSQASGNFFTYLKRLPSVLKENPNFTRYLVSSVLVLFGAMGINFYIIYAREVFQISDGFAANLTLVALVSQSLGIPMLGWFSDRFGHKWLAEFAALFGTAAVILMFFVPARGWMYPVFILMNLSVAGMSISRLSITMEFSGIDRLPTFTAIAGTVFAIPILLAPLIGGWILDMAGFDALFGTGLTLYVVGWAVLHFRVQDPRLHRRRPKT
jgi:MFS family permease